MRASLCTADKMCNAYNYSKASGCIPGNATALVGVNPNSENTTFVFINAALVPGTCLFGLALALTHDRKLIKTVIYSFS